MIGHNYMRAQFNIFEMTGNGTPTIIHDVAIFVQLHLFIQDFSK